MPRKATKDGEKPKTNTRSRNRRKVEEKPPKAPRKLLVASPRTVSEVGAVALGALGLITLLALASYHPDDASLNAAGREEIQNWAGAAGGYWADLLFQSLGVGAFPFGLCLIIASWKTLYGQQVLPSWREGLGLTALMVSVGTCAHLFLIHESHPYPPGGFVGAVLGQSLYENFAFIGGAIISVAAVLMSLALIAEGMVGKLANYTSILMQRGKVRVEAGVVMLQASREQLSERREARKEAKAARKEAQAEASDWELGDVDLGTGPSPSLEEKESMEAEVAEERETILARAKSKGRKIADKRADKEEAKIARESEQVIEDARLLLEPVRIQDNDAEFQLGDVETVQEPVEAAVVVSKAATTLAPAVEAQAPAEPKIRAARRAPSAEAVTPPVDGEGPAIVDTRQEVDEREIEKAAREADRERKKEEIEDFKLPPLSLLQYAGTDREEIDEVKLKQNADKLVKTLKDYGIEGDIREIRPGPIVTMYEYVPAPGVKVSKIAGLADDLAMAMEALRVRIVAPIPGKGAVGIEIPNSVRETVYIKELVADEAYRKAPLNLPIVLGKDIEGKPYVGDFAKMPHLLVAGATGSGKSVFVNAMIMSLLYRSSPDDVRFIMVDPKMLELSVYEGIPHLLLPVVTDPNKAAQALKWAVSEMERRYQIMSEMGVRNIQGFNKKLKDTEERGERLYRPESSGDTQPLEKLPFIVIIVDEFADLMMVASRDVESYIMRLAQKARAAGIHLLLATQRPSTDVLTGVIKANFPTRIAFQVASRYDSKTILDANGAENLLGRGDMLYQSPGVGGLHRVHGCLVTDEEVEETVNFLKSQRTAEYDETILQSLTAEEPAGGSDDEPVDELYDKAVSIVAEAQQASVSMVQRRLRIGYNRASRLVEKMEQEGIVGPADGAKPRAVLIQSL